MRPWQSRFLNLHRCWRFFAQSIFKQRQKIHFQYLIFEYLFLRCCACGVERRLRGSCFRQPSRRRASQTQPGLVNLHGENLGGYKIQTQKLGSGMGRFFFRKDFFLRRFDRQPEKNLECLTFSQYFYRCQFPPPRNWFIQAMWINSIIIRGSFHSISYVIWVRKLPWRKFGYPLCSTTPVRKPRGGCWGLLCLTFCLVSLFFSGGG